MSSLCGLKCCDKNADVPNLALAPNLKGWGSKGGGRIFLLWG